MKSLFYSYDFAVDCAYIIKIAGNAISEKMAAECADSCAKVGMKYEFWSAYDGTGEHLKPSPQHGQFMQMLKVTDHYLTKSEIACALSHISLWVKCVEDDKPLVVLEHDAIMIKPFRRHEMFNSICYLGCNEQVAQGWPVYKTPPHSAEGPNYHFMNRGHAYSIDPVVAKNMLSHVLKYGINMPLDMMVRADVFSIYQTEVFAYDQRNDKSTITARPESGRSTVRNDNLKL